MNFSAVLKYAKIRRFQVSTPAGGREEDENNSVIHGNPTLNVIP